MTKAEIDTFVYQARLMLGYIEKDQVEWASITIKLKRSGPMGMHTTGVPDRLRGVQND